MAQETARATLRGTVVAESGERVPYAVVVLEPGFGQRFSDEDGRFAFAGVAPGTYRLLVRQVGYTPFDSGVSISPGSAPIRVQLTRVAVRLTALTVASDAECRDPGRPDSTFVDLATVFEQLRENAERYRLLADSHPFRYRVARRFGDQLRAGREIVRTDTLTFASNARWAYAPGNVVTPDPDRWREGTQLVHLPVLADLADSTFQRTHCFTLRGIDRIEGRPLIRLDFRASRRLREPDVDGSAWLDADSYQIRQTRVSLTLLDRVAREVDDWTATTTFREIVPNLLVVERVFVVTTLRRNWSVLGRTEEQRLLSVDFLRPLVPE